MVSNGETHGELDRLAYAEARAKGFPMHRAVQEAGSHAKSVEALCNQARRLEAEPGVLAAIETLKAEIKARTDRAWERALEVLAADVEAPDAKDRRGAIELLGKIRGAFVQKHEVAGPGGGPLVLDMTPMLPTGGDSK